MLCQFSLPVEQVRFCCSTCAQCGRVQRARWSRELLCAVNHWGKLSTGTNHSKGTCGGE
jgi:hypothetical protein